MNTVNAVNDEQAGHARLSGEQRGRRHPARRRVLVAATVVAVLAAGGGGLADWLAHRHPAATGTGLRDNGAATTTVPVARQTLTSQTSVSGTLVYAGARTVLGQEGGIVTWLPAVGRVIRQGQGLYDVNGLPVVLLYGTTPDYRALAEGQYASSVSGPDIRQLNRDLVALGYASRADLNPSSDEFTWATKAGVEKMQQHLGLDPTGKLAAGQVVFLPSPARITSVLATLGGPASGPLLKASSTTPQVSVSLDVSLRSDVARGDRVTITLPGGPTIPGRVLSAGTVAATGPSGAATIPVVITPVGLRPDQAADQATVHVAVTTATARDALVVPVNALLVLAGGGYAVEVAGANGNRRLEPVTTGLFDDSDGLVQVTGAGLAVGQRVVVPAS